ncbi:hypothetical protein QLX08_010469 [Tetragonisca angustula]|uniref:Uncharacterized protein n=1 Tax=Tetragonisca angustula TaxID=166442 RepID=A0AAW0ZEW5_9HYME
MYIVIYHEEESVTCRVSRRSITCVLTRSYRQAKRLQVGLKQGTNRGAEFADYTTIRCARNKIVYEAGAPGSPINFHRNKQGVSHLASGVAATPFNPLPLDTGGGR